MKYQTGMKMFMVAFGLVMASGLFGSPLEDVISRLDRHGLWMNGHFQPVHQPADSSDEVLAGHFLAIANRASLKIDVLEKKEVSRFRIGISGMRAMCIRSERMISVPSTKTSGPEYCVILFRYDGPELGWWSRLYPIQDEN